MTYGYSSDVILAVGTAWGGCCASFATPPDGTPASLYVWDDLDDDGDPTTGSLLYVNETQTTVQNGTRQVANFTSLSAPAQVSGIFFVGASVSHGPDMHPAPGDQTAPYSDRCWITGNYAQGGFDPNDLNGPGSIGVYNNQADIGYFATWVLRAIGTNNDISLYCPGDGTGAACPCGNNASPDLVQGCRNSLSNGGAISPTGTCSVALDDFRVIGASLLPGQPALLFSGDSAIGGGNGAPFGDGLRCVGVSVVRHVVMVPTGLGTTGWGPGLGAHAGWLAGDVKRAQVWYRDPTFSPCGTGFNLTNAIRLELGP